MAIADIFLTIETNHRSFASRVYCIDPILHFCHFWALGASLEASFAKSICPAIIAYSTRNYDPGEIIILMMVFARTNERASAKHSSNAVSQKMAKDNLHCTMCISANLDCLPSH